MRPLGLPRRLNDPLKRNENSVHHHHHHEEEEEKEEPPVVPSQSTTPFSAPRGALAPREPTDASSMRELSLASSPPLTLAGPQPHGRSGGGPAAPPPTNDGRKRSPEGARGSPPDVEMADAGEVPATRPSTSRPARPGQRAHAPRRAHRSRKRGAGSTTTAGGGNAVSTSTAWEAFFEHYRATREARRRALAKELQLEPQVAALFAPPSTYVGSEGASPVVEGRLYVGSAGAAQDTLWLRANGITHVLNVADEVVLNLAVLRDAGIQYRSLSVADRALPPCCAASLGFSVAVPCLLTRPIHADCEFDIRGCFGDVFAFISAAYARSDGRVLVHCAAGVSRSATVVTVPLPRARAPQLLVAEPCGTWLRRRSSCTQKGYSSRRRCSGYARNDPTCTPTRASSGRSSTMRRSCSPPTASRAVPSIFMRTPDLPAALYIGCVGVCVYICM